MMELVSDSRDRIELPPEIVDQVLELVLDESFAETEDNKSHLEDNDHGRRSVDASMVEAIGYVNDR